MTSQVNLKHTATPDPSAQQRAASDPDVSVWVNASAGSGKTTILTSRVTRLLLAGVKPQRILCLTFTRAAAAEMSLRVMEKLSHWAVAADNDVSASLSDLQGRAPTKEEMIRARRLFAEALACPGGMRIRTLHAFGQEILRRFPVEANLPPHFTVIEETEARELQQETIKDILRETAVQPDTPLAKTVALLIGNLGEKTFHETVRALLHEKQRLAKARTQHKTTQNLIAKIRLTLDLLPEDTETSLRKSAFTASWPEQEIRDVAQCLLQGTPTYAKRGQAILSWLEQPQPARLASANIYSAQFLKKDGDPYSKFADNALLKKHPHLNEYLSREAARLQSLEERCATAAGCELTAATLIFGEELNTRYAAAKRRRAVLDYDDLVAETLNLLRRPGIAPWVLHKLDEGLDHLLVDEAQDTSRAQWEIVALLADEFFAGATARLQKRTLFVVGDEKQSIYSFQNADPEAFAEMRDYFRQKIADANERWSEIPLHISFRSAPAILRAVDAVFAIPEAMAGVSPVPVEHESFWKHKLFGRVELWPLMPRPPETTEAETPWQLPLGYETEHDPQAELADNIAARIRLWIENGETLPGMDRPIRPGDVMILLRRRGRFADLMVRALKQKPSIPVTGVDRMRLMEQLPVMDLLALLRFTLLPEDDLNLACILRGPLMNLSEEDLMQLAANRKDITFWQSLKQAREQYAQIHDYLAAWLNRADLTTPFTMLVQILNEPCPADTLGGRRALWKRLGPDALDPIEELLNAAQNFSRRHAPSLQNFLQWLAAGDSEIKRELDRGGEGAGQVRIMTVHAAKGLEAPIVFLPDTANMPRMQDLPKFLWDEPTGLPFYIARKPSGGMALRVWETAREKQLQEYRRLLYVAMTRASHRLYVCGWELKKRDPGDDMNWHNLIINGLQESETHTEAPEEMIVWEDPAPRAENRAAPIPAVTPPLPSWAFLRAAPETIETRTLSPSQLAALPAVAAPDRAFARGRIIHRLLQSLPDIESTQRKTVATRFLAHPQYALDAEQQTEITAEVMRLLEAPEHAILFGTNSRAEVPLAGMIGGKKIAGQVDRLALHENEVWIVDYKTNRPPPKTAAGIPEAYRAQMAAYRAVLQEIYPRHTVRCFLLWTCGPRLMEC